MMSPRLRRLNLLAHIAFSVAWIGAAVAFLVLSIAGLTSKNEAVVRGAYLSMDLVCMYSIVPLSLIAWGTGLVQSLGTQWGLFRHYWVLAKFLLTTLSVAILLLHQFKAMARAAALSSAAVAGTLPKTELSTLGFVLLRASALGILVLLVVTVLSVYKPWGLTPYGLRVRGAGRYSPGVEMSGAFYSTTAVRAGLLGYLRFPLVVGIGGVVLVAVVSMHLSGHSFHHGHHLGAFQH